MERISRKVDFISIKAGTVRITVVDKTCGYCGTLNSEGMFAFNKYVVFDRELLDQWVYNV